MKRTISVMLGKGSVNHNSRQFKATNIDAERTSLNTSYCNTPVKDVYHELFDEALQRYNAKQKRATAPSVGSLPLVVCNKKTKSLNSAMVSTNPLLSTMALLICSVGTRINGKRGMLDNKFCRKLGI